MTKNEILCQKADLVKNTGRDVLWISCSEKPVLACGPSILALGLTHAASNLWFGGRYLLQCFLALVLSEEKRGGNRDSTQKAQNP